MDPIDRIFPGTFQIPDVITDFDRGHVGLAGLLKSGLDYHQRQALNQWLYLNSIKRVKVEHDGYIKRVNGLSVYEGEELSPVTIEFILWDKLKAAYKKDFAKFIKGELSKEDKDEK